MSSLLSRDVAANRERSYRVRICPGLSTGSIAELVQAIGSRKSLIVTTPTVARLYTNEITKRLIESGVDIDMVVIECSEQSKTLSEVEQLCEQCFRTGLDRRSVLIGCGGGVCTDLVTMTASLARRGLSYIRIPTTLIGLIDAGIGIKGAVNLPGKKSALGCFHPPEHVFLDPAFLRSLPHERIADGLAEAIKVAVVTDSDLFEFIDRYMAEFFQAPSAAELERFTELVWRSSIRLLEELEPNPYEDKSYCRLLDFGHTFSPFIESESGFAVSHGMAVSIDIALSTAIAFELGLVSGWQRDRILALLRNAGLPIDSPLLTVESCGHALTQMAAHRGGHLNLVLPTGIGNGIFLSEQERLMPVLRGALDFLRREIHAPVVISSNVSPIRPDAATSAYEKMEPMMPLFSTETGT